MMTDEELAAIRARADAATPGPWMCWNGYELRVPHAEPPVMPDMAMVRIGPEPHIGTGISSVRPYDDIRALRPDAEFVAYAREDVPALLAEVERLRARVAALEAIARTVANGVTTYRDREDEYCTQDDNCMWRSLGQGQPFQMVHTDRCIVTKARALLASDDTTTTESAQ